MFCYDENIVAVLRLDDFENDETKLIQIVKNVLDQFEIDAGSSNSFTALSKLRYYYRQACQALLLGRRKPGPRRLYRFGDYALQYMLYHSSGDFPVQYICPPNLVNLRTENQKSCVDYWRTLQLFLDNQMNIAKTAEDLQIHRNTLVQRMAKIKNILAMDLDDPNTQMWLRICIALFDLESGE